MALVCAQRWNEGGALVTFSAEGDDFVRPARTLGRHPARFVFDPRPLWRALGEGTFDLIDVREEPFSLAALEIVVLRALHRSQEVPFVVYSAQNLDKSYPPPFSWIERLVLRTAAGAYVCNRAAAERLRRHGLRAPVVELPIGVETESLARASPRPPSGALRVGYVGRLTPSKGVAVLLRALCALEGAELEVVGDGPARRELAEQAAKLGLAGRVRFSGHLSGEALREAYLRFDVVVVPSLTTPSWAEQFCRVAVEAMAAGAVVVASDSGALPEVVGDAGLIVPENDAQALAAALRRLAADSALCARLTDAGRVRAEEFSWSNVARQQLEFYERVSRPRRARR